MIKGDLNKKLLVAISTLPDMDDGITLIDVGASGGIEPRWAQIAPALNYIGFEPDERTSAPLLENRNDCLQEIIHPFAVWSEECELGINLCNSPGTSSHFLPNRELLDRFPDKQRFDIVEHVVVSAKTIDSFDIPAPHFMKIDIQGGELAVLNGSVATLDRMLGAELEVEFLELYKGQPLFGEVCTRLADAGLEFVDFTNLCRWERHAHQGYGDCVFGDGLFLRSPEAMIARTDDPVHTKSAWLAICLLYNRFDLIRRFLDLLPGDQRSSFSAFEKSMAGIEAKFSRGRLLLRAFYAIARRLGFEYRYHMIY